MKLIYIHFDGLVPRIVTIEEAIQMFAESLIAVSNPEAYATLVLNNADACGNSSFDLNDSGEMLMVVVEDAVEKTDSP